MRKSAVALAAFGLLSAFTAVAPVSAQAHEWDHGWRGEEWREHHSSGPGIALGVIGGILTGAMIASAQGHAPPAYYNYPAPYAGYGYYYAR